MTRTVLIIMSNTGGGHRASAEALKATFDRQYGDAYQVHIIDLLLDYLPYPLNQLPKSYSFIADQTPWLWHALWQLGRLKPLASPLTSVAVNVSSKPVAEIFASYAPDLVISVHPLVQTFILRALQEIHSTAPFAIVVTDLATVHPLWFHTEAALCFVASDRTYRRAQRHGMRSEQLRQYGLPVRPVFATMPEPKAILRQKLGMDAGLPAALLVGGGEGMGRVGKIAEAAAQRLHDNGTPIGQMVVVCGRNQKLQQRLGEYQWPIPTRVHGFVNNMSDWMAACDCIVTKAGPGTIAEALIRGLPIILSGYIPGQESGNVPYVIKNQVGKFSQEPEEIAEIIRGWFGPKRGEMEMMAANAHRLGNPRATYQIVDEIVGLLE